MTKVQKPGEGRANSCRSTSWDHWGVFILQISWYSRDWRWLWQLQSLQRYTLIWGFLQDYSGDKERRNRQQLCAHNTRHLNERDRVPGPYLGRATPGVTGEQWTAMQGHPTPPQAPLSMPRGGGRPSLPTLPPAENGGIPSDFLLFWDEGSQFHSPSPGRPLPSDNLSTGQGLTGSRK